MPGYSRRVDIGLHPPFARHLGEDGFERRDARDAPDQVREALPAQQVPHLAMRPGDGKPNALALQRRAASVTCRFRPKSGAGLLSQDG